MRKVFALFLVAGSVGSAVALDPYKFRWDSPVGIVTRLYHDYASDVVLEFNSPYTGVKNEPRKVLEKYFDAPLTEALLEDQRCAEAEGGLCSLDFHPMWGIYDSSGTKVQDIEDLPKAGDVVVKLRYPTGDEGQLTYHVVKTAKGWRIHDIETDRWSLWQLLHDK